MEKNETTVTTTTTTTSDTETPATSATQNHPANSDRKRNSNSKLKYESLDRIRSIYRSATHSFLHNHHLQVWSSISTGIQSIHQLLTYEQQQQQQQHPQYKSIDGRIRRINPSTIINQYSTSTILIDQELLELDRKFQILRITFLSCLRFSSFSSNLKLVGSINNSLNDHPSSSPSKLDQISASKSLVDLIRLEDPTQFFIASLSQPSLNLHQTSDQPSSSPSSLSSSSSSSPPPRSSSIQSQLNQLSIDLHQIHPSILTAIGLASIKLGIPHIGRQLIEAWLASLDDQSLESLDLAFNHPPPHSPQSYHDPQSNHSIPTESYDHHQYHLTAELRQSYHKLIQLYSVHILGSLDESDFAIEFLNSQSHQSGGILPPDIVQDLIKCVETQKVQRLESIQKTIQRQQERQLKQQQQQQAFNSQSVVDNRRQRSTTLSDRTGSISNSNGRFRSSKPSNPSTSPRSNESSTTNTSHRSSDESSRSPTRSSPLTRNRSSRIEHNRRSSNPYMNHSSPPSSSSPCVLSRPPPPPHHHQQQQQQQGSTGFSSFRNHLSKFMSPSSTCSLSSKSEDERLDHHNNHLIDSRSSNYHHHHPGRSKTKKTMLTDSSLLRTRDDGSLNDHHQQQFRISDLILNFFRLSSSNLDQSSTPSVRFTRRLKVMSGTILFLTYLLIKHQPQSSSSPSATISLSTIRNLPQLHSLLQSLKISNLLQLFKFLFAKLFQTLKLAIQFSP